MLDQIDCYEGSGSKMRARGVQSIHHDGADLGRENILCSHLNDTGCITRCAAKSLPKSRSWAKTAYPSPTANSMISLSGAVGSPMSDQ